MEILFEEQDLLSYRRSIQNIQKNTIVETVITDKKKVNTHTEDCRQSPEIRQR